MAKNPHEDSPDNKPASPGHLAGQDGAAPSSSGGGPTGSGARLGEAAPRVSLCAKPEDGGCGGVFPASPVSV
jgi:hypothetical protein